jgi:methyl-accepting chemotaxis protein
MKDMDFGLKLVAGTAAVTLASVGISHAIYGQPAGAALLASIGIGLALATGVGIGLAAHLVRPIHKLAESAERLSAGDLEQEYAISTGGAAQRLAMSLKTLTHYLKDVAASTDLMARGDIGSKVAVVGSKDLIGKSLERLRDTLETLSAEISRLVLAAQNGDLEQRGDVQRFEGFYSDLLVGLNETMNAMEAPIDEAGEVLKCVADRDLSARMCKEHVGDYAKVKESLNTALVNLEDTLSQAVTAAQRVNSSANQIRSASQSLSQSASEQAASLEEISGSVHEMSSMISQNASSSAEARSLAEAARASAEKGVHSMQKMSDSIARIKESSDSTARIVKTIDEIAFQTNLLALNAAVEAARAGDAGKGFAVVAEEVRNLAMRCAEAAKNTATLIEESVNNAEGGVQINREVIQNLDEIQSNVHQVADVINRIAAASEQQSQGATQITTAIEQMNVLTQQLASSAEESAASGEHLSNEARNMHEMIGQFRLTKSSVSVPTQHNPAKSKAFALNHGAPGHFTNDSEDNYLFSEKNLALEDF